MKKVSIIIPVVRYKNIDLLISRIVKNAGIPTDQYNITFKEDTERIGCPKMVKDLVDNTESEHVCFIGDDTMPQKNFLKIALEHMSRLPGGWGLVGLGDGTGRDLPCHWLASRKLLPKLDGEFFHTGYKHCFCDNELALRCRQIDKFVMAQDAQVLHNHPLINNADWDEDYKRVYSDEYMKHDEKLFSYRVNNNWGSKK